VIRGAFLVAVGFGLGYAKAMSDQEELREAAVAFKQFLQDAALEDEIKRKQAADAAAEAETGAAPGKTLKDFNDERAASEGAEEVVEAEVIDPPDETDDAVPQGETTS
jgi:hypothetical protein